MTELEQKKFASTVRLLQTAYPRNWDLHLRNLGVTASADPPLADLDRMVGQTGSKTRCLDRD